jgi:hypothetical protein
VKHALILAIGLAIGLISLSIAQADPRKDRVVGQGQIAFRGHGPEWWYNRASVRYHQARTLQSKLGDRTRALIRARRVTLTSPDALTAIRIASLVYHVDFNMLYRRASCESMGELPASPPSNATLYPGAHNSSGASGLFQFLDGTWDSTPFADYDVYNGYVNALAAAWMMGPANRGGEWSCR